MRKTIQMIVIALLATTMSFVFVAHAQDAPTDTELQVADQTFSDPGTTPDNFMYGFKRFGEGFQKFFTFDPVDRAKLNLKFAKLRLAEAKAMADDNKQQYIYNLINEYNKELDEADQNTPFGQRISDILKEANSTLPRSLLVLEQVYAKAPDSAKHGLEMAINNSIQKMIRWQEKHNASENETDDDFENRTWPGIHSRAMLELEKHKMKIAQMGEKKDDMMERSLERLSELLDDAEEHNQTARIEALRAIQAKIEERIAAIPNITQVRIQKIEEIQSRIRQHAEDKIETALNTTCVAPTGETMTLQEALGIAQTQCADGFLKRPVLCNDYTGTWWIDFKPLEGKHGCNPACVIDVVNKSAEINWRCTGLISGPNSAINSGLQNREQNEGEDSEIENQLGSGNGNGNGP